MSKKPTRPRDTNQLAKRIVDIATGERERDSHQTDSPTVERARKGGKAGGPARAEKLSAEERSEIARKAAKARWETPTD